MNRSNRSANDNPVQILIDIAVLFVSFGISVMYADRLSRPGMGRCLSFVCLFTIIYVLSNKGARIYNVTFFFYLDRFVKIITLSWARASVCSLAVLYLYDPGPDLYRFYVAFLLVAYPLLVVNVFFSRMLQIVFSGKNAPRTALVGRFEDYERFQYYLNKTSMKMNVIGFILRGDEAGNGQFNVIGSLKNLEEAIRENDVDQIFFIQRPDEVPESLEPYIQLGLRMGVTIRILLDTCRFLQSWSYVSALGKYPMITYHRGTLNTRKEHTDG